MINELSSTTIKVIGGLLLAMMFAILALVAYSVLKPPIVNKQTIETLVTTAKNTESYVKELRELAYKNRQETNEDNNLFDTRQKEGSKSYQDLYQKYGLTEGGVNAKQVYRDFDYLVDDYRVPIKTDRY